ncbi:MAG: hypothetical protein ABIU54_11665, partial [Candidatus Eisenbacteria bacterium]
CAMATLVLFGYSYALRQGFSNDDFLIFREVALHPASFELGWARLIAGYWRPWSREFHFWGFHHAFGLNPVVFHAVNLVLWLGVLAALLAWLRRILDPRTAVLVVAGAFAASTWGVFVVWASCSQDLWMLLLGALFLLAQSQGRGWLATIALALALLSKETAVLVFAIGVWSQYILKGRAGLSLREWWGPALAVAVWALVHPSIGGRVLFHSGDSFAPGSDQGLSASSVRFALAPLNLESLPTPQQGWPRALGLGAIWSGVLGALAWFALREVPARSALVSRQRQWLALGLGWWAIAWMPLLVSVAPWHSYYGWIGFVGLWVAIVGALGSYPRVVVAMIALVALLRPASANTYRGDWGTELDQSLAAQRTERIREQLLAFHPTLPPGSRIIIAGVPSFAGLLTSPRQSAAAEVWYHDTTVTIVGLSQYWRRGPNETAGEDHFYVLDREQKLYPLATGILLVPDSLRALPEWAGAEEKVGAMFAQASEWERARAIFARLASTYPAEPREAFNLSVVYANLGDADRAELWRRRADSLSAKNPEAVRTP